LPTIPKAAQPMMATAAAALPDGPQWSYEVKWDGYRAQIVKRGPTIALASRNLKDITKQYPTVVAAAATLNARDAVVDGEIVALDDRGQPSFQALHHSQAVGVSIVFYAFDLLHLNGRDLTREPLEARQRALRKVVTGSRILLSEPLAGTPADIVPAVRQLGLEGVVAKRKRSMYAIGRRSDSWIKVRFAKHQELVIGGFKPAGAAFDSILVGYYDDGPPEGGRYVRRLICAGKVRNGLTPLLRAQLMERFTPLITIRCPFANLPSPRSSHWGEGITAEEMNELRWLKPKLVAEVSFTEWTRDGSLRHAAFIGLRDDKNPREVAREEVTERPSPSSRSSP